MAINYFEREVKNFRKRFNHCFGKEVLCNLEARQVALMSVLWLGVLVDRINGTKDKEVIKRFYEVRKSLCKSFDNFEEKERRMSDAETERGASYRSRRSCSL